MSFPDIRAGSALGITLALAAFNPLAADGVVRDSIGPISSGRGGANIAFSDNLALINDNPAGLTGIPGLRFDLGVDLLKADIDYRDPQNDTSAKDEVFVLPNAGVSYRVSEEPVKVTLGFGIFMPAGYGAEYTLNHNVYGSQKYHSQSGLYKFMPSIAVELFKGFSVGAGVGLAYEKLDLELPYTFQTGALMGVPALIDLETDGFGPAYNIGVQYKITERWTIGVAYIEETRIDLKGQFDVNVAGSPLAQNPIIAANPSARYHVEAENTWPRSLGAATAYRWEKLVASVEFVWFDWSSAFDTLDFHLSRGNNPVFDGLAGPTPYDQFPVEWHDSYTVRLGGEYLLTPEDTIRAGYIYITNPIPNRTLTPLVPAILEHSICFGYGHRFGDRVGLDFAYQFSFGSRQSVGKSDIAGGDFDSSSVDASAHWFFFGANLKL